MGTTARSVRPKISRRGPSRAGGESIMNVVKVSSGLAVLSNPVVQKRRSFPFCAWHKMGKFTHIVPGAKWEILEENGGEEADDGQNYGLDHILSSDIR